MLPGLHGDLLSHYFAEEFLRIEFAGQLGEASRNAARERLARWWCEQATALGPASSLRAVFDCAAAPLVTTLGFEVADAASTSDAVCYARLWTFARTPVGLLVTRWGEDLDRCWRDAVRHGIRLEARWCLCFNVVQLRLVDAARSYSRSFLEFDVEAALDDRRTFEVLWSVCRADALSPPTAEPDATTPALIDQIIERSAGHAAGVCASLRQGVLAALRELVDGLAVRPGRTRTDHDDPASLTDIFAQCLTIVYRVLFLLFAEARGLVPLWHPIYRDSYTIEALREMVDDPTRPAGLWETLQAISRLAHSGCHAGSLKVTPFNGRLFSPERTPLGDTAALDDETARRVIGALSSRSASGGAGRERIVYRDLGVEQLGAVYESVLDYEPGLVPGRPNGDRSRPTPRRVELVGGSGRRKATGTFYTPRSITDYLVRRTLHPLTDGAAAEDILQLRVLDPSMGSGAFLVSACRYLAAAYEAALVREKGCVAGEIGASDRARFRRAVAQRCLFGVDVNPMAVQLARLSIWLATLAADRPLTFLDHHLLAGDSLLGATLEDLARQPPRVRSRRAPRVLPLFEAAGFESAVRGVLPERMRVALEAGDTLAAVREKEQTLARLSSPAGALSRWKTLADLWCACWFWDSPAAAPGAGAFADLTDAILEGRSMLPASTAARYLNNAREIAARHKFFHWTLEFPEVFFDADGQPFANGGFDAVLGNPPWDMLRADDPRRTSDARREVEQLMRFVRGSGVYTAHGGGHVNRYQLFIDRALRLVRHGGRVGFVVPSGLATDHGCAALRRTLFDRCDTDTIVGLDNRSRIFPIHRSVRFILLTTTAGGRTRSVRCRFGESRPAALDAIPDDLRSAPPDSFPVVLTPSLIERLSGSDFAIPELKSALDIAIAEKIATACPTLGAADGWHATFGRELNATEDRRHFTRSGEGLPIVEGKQVEPFYASLAACRFQIPQAIASSLVGTPESFRRARLAYRDVASATNKLTLIAAIVPAGAITTHTLFCLKTALDVEAQAFLCGMLNSYVANYLVRMSVTTHVTVALVERLPVPAPDRSSPIFKDIARLAITLAETRAADAPAHARLQALAAVLYGVSADEFRHVLGTFPLVEEAVKAAALGDFSRVTN